MFLTELPIEHVMTVFRQAETGITADFCPLSAPLPFWPGARWPSSLRSLRIGVRLTCCFAVMVSILLLCAGPAIWQLRYYGKQVQKLRSIDRRMISVLKVNNEVLSFRELMQTAASTNSKQKVREALVPFRATFLKDVAEASAALRDSVSKGEGLQRTTLTLLSYRTAIPDEINTTLELSELGDWQAIHYRLQRQMMQTRKVLGQAVNEIEAAANAERGSTLETMSAIQHRVVEVFPIVLTLFLLGTGGILGTWVTRSVAQPLHLLETGAKALGSGNFSYRVAVVGRDELTTLALAFNRAAAQIEQLHSGLETLVDERTADLQEANQTLQRLSCLDPLTGIANRRKLDETMQQEFAHAQKTQAPVSLLMVDVDHFKGLNDAYGHQRGDECLIQVVRTIEAIPLRRSDLLARYGGEEFAVLLPCTGVNEAKVVAERIRLAVEVLNIPNCGSPRWKHLSISIGVASVQPDTGAQLATLIERADQALYRAKESGRNRVCV